MAINYCGNRDHRDASRLAFMRLQPARSLLLLLALAFALASARAAEGFLWLENGQPSAQATQAVQALLSAAEHGLDPSDYQSQALGLQLAQAHRGAMPSPDEQAQLDTAITQALQRYLADLRDGRVDPRRIHARFSVQRRPAVDTLRLLREAVAAHQLAEVLAHAQPGLPMYATLRDALARYRELAGHPAWREQLPPLPGRALAAGQAWAGLPLLAQRLQALGELPAGSPAPDRLEEELLAALLSFQERHGLERDGLLGPATLRQLDVTPAARARQIELAMERLRWTPYMQGPRMIVVNVPEFVLRAYEVHDGRIDVRASMKVIVGKAMDTRTPLFDETMRFIEFSPYWNVPPSIARGEIIPRLRSDPAYFTQQGFEFVTGEGQVVTSLSAGHLDAVLHGGWRIRQRPGPHNALGDIKFIFPNNQNIYLHHTPATQLFQRNRRDLSHGCIRVEQPVELAEFVLRDEPDWTRERIRQAMDGGVSTTIALKNPLPVLIAYSTAIAKGGRVHFYPDLYGHDRVLDQALRQRTKDLPPLPGVGAAAR